MYMRGVVTLIKQKMVGILKTVWSAMALKLALLLRIITVNGIVLMTLIARSFKNLFAWIVSNIKRLPVIRTIVEEYNKVEPMFVNKQAGQIGKLLLITAPLTLLLVIVHLSLGLYHVLKAMMAKLLKRG
jgi:uncharacterized membrane protein